MCASVGRSLDNDNNTIGLFSAFHGPQRRFREQTCKVVVVENHVTHRLSSSFHSTLTKTPSSPIAPAGKNVWRRHCVDARLWSGLKRKQCSHCGLLAPGRSAHQRPPISTSACVTVVFFLLNCAQIKPYAFVETHVCLSFG